MQSTNNSFSFTFTKIKKKKKEQKHNSIDWPFVSHYVICSETEKTGAERENTPYVQTLVHPIHYRTTHATHIQIHT